MRRGEVYWYDFGSKAKRRPVLILTGSRSLPHLSTATVAVLTTTVRGTRSEVSLSPAHGVPKACAVNLHQLHTVEQAALGPRITHLSDERMVEVEHALSYALGLGERDEEPT